MMSKQDQMADVRGADVLVRVFRILWYARWLSLLVYQAERLGLPARQKAFGRGLSSRQIDVGREMTQNYEQSRSV
jgi:hypothetical protein